IPPSETARTAMPTIGHNLDLTGPPLPRGAAGCRRPDATESHGIEQPTSSQRRPNPRPGDAPTARSTDALPFGEMDFIFSARAGTVRRSRPHRNGTGGGQEMLAAMTAAQINVRILL